MTKNKSELKFEYCECGCKGYEAGTRGNSFWIYWDLKNTFTLNNGHSWAGTLIKKFSSYGEAVKEATRLFKINLEHANNCLK